mgnify:CR=1 FL=1
MGRGPRYWRKRRRSTTRRRDRVLLRLPLVSIVHIWDGWLVLSNGERIYAAEARGRYRGTPDAALLFTA